jgi:hypothetical protein
MSRNLSLLSVIKIALIASFVSCTSKGEVNSEVAEEGVYGEGIVNEKPVDYKTLMAEMASKDTVHTTIRATVSEVCQKKGCWMTLVDAPAGDSEIMVRFKDYGFFVPKDIGGRQVIVEGKAFKSVTPVEELRHYAEDAGKSAEEIAQITEPEEKISFEATGVKVLDKE